MTGIRELVPDMPALLADLRRRPGVWIGQKSIERLNMMLAGVHDRVSGSLTSNLAAIQFVVRANVSVSNLAEAEGGSILFIQGSKSQLRPPLLSLAVRRRRLSDVGDAS